MIGGHKSSDRPDREKKYGRVVLGQNTAEKDIQYERFILNLDSELIFEIEKFISEQQLQGVKMLDEHTGKLKKINKSSWARKVFTDVLKAQTTKKGTF